MVAVKIVFFYFGGRKEGAKNNFWGGMQCPSRRLWLRAWLYLIKRY